MIKDEYKNPRCPKSIDPTPLVSVVCVTYGSPAETPGARFNLSSSLGQLLTSQVTEEYNSFYTYEKMVSIISLIVFAYWCLLTWQIL